MCHCLLIEGAEGLVLVDTGFGIDDTRDPSRLGRLFNATIRPRLDEAETVLGTALVVARALREPDREAAEREYILKKLEETNGNVTRTAELLGLERSNLYRKMKTLGIGPKE